MIEYLIRVQFTIRTFLGVSISVCIINEIVLQTVSIVLEEK